MFDFQIGFQNSVYFVDLNVAEDKAWSFIQAFSGKSKHNYKPIEDLDYYFREPALWDTGQMQKPLGYNEYNKKKNYIKAILYDPVTTRLLVTYSYWKISNKKK